LQKIGVKVGGSVIQGKPVPSRGLKMAAIRARVMDGSPHHRRIVSPVFHDINFTTGRPAAIGRMFGHQPKRRPITPPPGEFRAKFEATVFFGKKPLTFQAGGRVKSSVGRFSSSYNVEDAVADTDILRTVGVILQFVISPATMISNLERPMIRINRDAVELVAPDQLPIPSRRERSQRDRRASQPRAQASGAKQ